MTSHNVTSPSQAPQPGTSDPTGNSDPSSVDTKTGLSPSVIVVTAVSGGFMAMIIGLAVPCYIWRKRRNTRFK